MELSIGLFLFVNTCQHLCCYVILKEPSIIILMIQYAICKCSSLFNDTLDLRVNLLSSIDALFSE
jgi:hypothetical protein